MQVAPFLQGDEAHSSMSSSQVLPLTGKKTELLLLLLIQDNGRIN